MVSFGFSALPAVGGRTMRAFTETESLLLVVSWLVFQTCAISGWLPLVKEPVRSVFGRSR